MPEKIPTASELLEGGGVAQGGVVIASLATRSAPPSTPASDGELERLREAETDSEVVLDDPRALYLADEGSWIIARRVVALGRAGRAERALRVLG